MTLVAAIRKRLSPAFALDVAFEAPAGITILFGASGSGKTTLLRCLAGLDRPDAGSVTIAGQLIFDSTTRVDTPAPRRRTGYVFQQLALFPHLTVAGNLEYGLPALAAPARRNRIGALAESLRIVHLLNRRPAEISGGERQRVALARSLVTDPALLLLDEPLSALDHATQSRIMDDLRAWNIAHGIPILYVTHAHREVFALGERVIAIDKGQVIAVGTPHDVMDLPAHETVALLAGFENLFTASVTARRPEMGLMQCRLSDTGTEVEVPLSTTSIGTPIRIAIRAGDILLANQEPHGLSARNILRGHIVALTREGATVIAHVLAGERFIVHLTPSALESLHLRVGERVWLIIKTHSCRLVSL